MNDALAILSILLVIAAFTSLAIGRLRTACVLGTFAGIAIGLLLFRLEVLP